MSMSYKNLMANSDKRKEPPSRKKPPVKEPKRKKPIGDPQPKRPPKRVISYASWRDVCPAIPHCNGYVGIIIREPGRNIIGSGERLERSYYAHDFARLYATMS